MSLTWILRMHALRRLLDRILSRILRRPVRKRKRVTVHYLTLI